MDAPARKLMARLNALGRVSDERGALTRVFCSPAMRRANALVGRWMRAAGMDVRADAIGNLRGRFAGQQPGSKTLLLGSHLDTVRNAGKFDGALGVLLAIACVERLQQARRRLPFAIEVIGFADEEGVRFQTACLGSRVVAGDSVKAALRRTDRDGISMADALRRFGGQPGRLAEARLEGRRLLGYIEAHIEQGPVLEKRNLALGIVTAMAGQSRFAITFTGGAAHAGTTPMSMRRDALCAAAEFILVVETEARRIPGLVATVGQIQAQPNASNVIPGTVALSLDVRHSRDGIRYSAVKRFGRIAGRIAARRDVKLSIQAVQGTCTVSCSPRLSDLLARAVQNHQSNVPRLPSGAGHDAAHLARITPVAMLFIRCRGGLSHHPGESVAPRDVGLALDAMADFIELQAVELQHRPNPAADNRVARNGEAPRAAIRSVHAHPRRSR